MDAKAIEELLDELFSSLEALETKSAATLQFLKDRDHVTDEDLAAYLEQAGKASNVRWRAARLRMMSLLASALKNVGPATGKTEPTTKGAESVKEEAPASDQSQDNPEGEPASAGPTASASVRSGEPPTRDEGAGAPEARKSSKPPAQTRATRQAEKATPEAETPKHPRDSEHDGDQKSGKDRKPRKHDAA